MSRKVNPHALVVVGENSFIRLSIDDGSTISSRCSHWRVLWSPVGAGHALFMETADPQSTQVFGDNERLVRYLQTEIESVLYKPFANLSLPIQRATFRRTGSPPNACEEVVEFEEGDVRLTWNEFLEPFNYTTEPGDDGRPIGLQTTFFPAKSASWSDRGHVPAGCPWNALRDEQPSTSACLAWAETWSRPR